MVSTKKAIFYLDGKEYGMDVMDVRTIEKCTLMETVENAPKNMKGKIELRGETLPIISLRAKFGLDEIASAGESRWIITKSNGISVAYEVDKMKGIVDTQEDVMYSMPSILEDDNTSYVKEVLDHEGKLILILDKEGILTVEEQSDLKELLNALQSDKPDLIMRQKERLDSDECAETNNEKYSIRCVSSREVIL